MKSAAFCLLFALNLSAQVIFQDSAVSRLASALQQINAQTVDKPVFLVIAVQTNDATLATLARVRELGLMLQPLVANGRGEIAVLSYGDQVQTVQPFTPYSGKAVLAIADLKPDGALARKIDAVAEAISALDTRPPDRGRVVLVIGEWEDRGSKTNMKDALTRAKLSNVLIYNLAF